MDRPSPCPSLCYYLIAQCLLYTVTFTRTVWYIDVSHIFSFMLEFGSAHTDENDSRITILLNLHKTLKSRVAGSQVCVQVAIVSAASVLLPSRVLCVLFEKFASDLEDRHVRTADVRCGRAVKHNGCRSACLAVTDNDQRQNVANRFLEQCLDLTREPTTQRLFHCLQERLFYGLYTRYDILRKLKTMCPLIKSANMRHAALLRLWP